MHWFTAFVLYVLIWWTVLFMVLPFGTRPVSAPDSLTGWRGAPTTPRMARKVLWTTALTTVIWIGALLVINSSYLSFRPSPDMGW